IIRFYEGYPWENSVLGRWRKGRHQKKFDAVQARWAGLHGLLHSLGPQHPHYGALMADWTDLYHQLQRMYPDARSLVLPTRLGNVIRNFERYSSVEYKIESIVLWPRLINIIDKDYATAVDTARTSFNFMLNLSLLSGILALVIAGAGLVYMPPEAMLRVGLPVLGCGFLAYWFYQLSIAPAATWGSLVKGAFDLFRWDLLKKLGYQQQPTTRKAERDLWHEITQQMIYGDKRQLSGDRAPRIDYAPAQAPTEKPTAASASKKVDFEITRGMKPTMIGEQVRVIIGVKHADNDVLDNLVIKDTLPDGLIYKWDSATAHGRTVRVVGTNPYQFHISGTVPGDAEVVLTYYALYMKYGPGQ
ncbi:MAG: hypothetical protein ACE5G0_19720, partial [Rhodothermales bacterium]